MTDQSAKDVESTRKTTFIYDSFDPSHSPLRVNTHMQGQQIYCYFSLSWMLTSRGWWVSKNSISWVLHSFLFLLTLQFNYGVGVNVIIKDITCLFFVAECIHTWNCQSSLWILAWVPEGKSVFTRQFFFWSFCFHIEDSPAYIRWQTKL